MNGRPGGMGRPGGPGGPMGYAPKARAKDAKAVVARLWGYLGGQAGRLLLAFALVLLASLMGLAGPVLTGRAIDAMAKGLGGRVDFGALRVVAYAMAALCAANAAVAWFQNYVMVTLSQHTVRDLRRDLFAKLQTLPVRFFDTHPHGDLMSRLANDVENVSNTLTQGTTQVLSSVIVFAGSLVAMLALSPALTGLSLVTIPLGIFMTGQVATRTRSHFAAQQKELGELNAHIEETIGGQRVVKAFGREAQVSERFSSINLRLRDSAIKAQIYGGLMGPFMNVIGNLSFAIVAAAGGWLVLKGDITIGTIAAFLNFSKQFARPINELANQVNMLQSGLAGAERVFEVLDEEEEGVDPPEATELTRVAGDVRFRDVSFGYVEGVPVLRDVDLTARPGQTIALVGPTGAGKTTVVNLMMRFYDVSDGSIFIDGKDIRSLKRGSLRRSLGIVLQDTYLFAGTARENIRYGRLEATDVEVEEAARLANADPFIQRLSQGYDTVLSAEGGNLSQGQRQLITIARAILADPAILILDEATSSVDTRTEMHIQEAMLSLMKGRTSFVIAHRLSTIQGADRILVIDGGRIVEGGTHEELVAAKGFYYGLYSAQFRRQAELQAAEPAVS